MTTTKLILVRHGETDDNKNRIFQGQSGRGLDAHGREQAARLAARLSGAQRRPVALYASDLERARETAEILGRALGLAPRLDPALREVSLGAWQGLSYEEVEARFPAEWEAWRRGVDLKRGGGESYAELGDRMERAAGRIADAHPGEAALVVSHGAAIKILVGRALGVGAPGLRAFRVPANTGVTVLEREDDGRFRLVLWNDAAHLGDPVLEAIDG
jgi:probable phosphoglycerate mutase